MQLAKAISDDLHADLMGYLKNSSVTTFSHYVKDIVSLPKLGDVPDGPSHFSHYKLMVSEVDQLDLLMKDVCSSWIQAKNYVKKVRCLAPWMYQITSAMWKVDPNAHVTSSNEYLKWLCVSCEDITDCLQDAQTNKPSRLVSASLRLTSVLERSLQDLLWTVDGKTPTVLKEVLQSKTLANILGDEVTAFLDVIVGPPTSLNIRNLLWHGFGSANERPEKFVMVIYIALILIGHRLHHKNIKVAHRPFIHIDTKILSALSTAVDLDNIERFEAFISTVSIKSEEMTQALSYAKDEKYGLAVMLLLPSFEHFARVAYCVFNKCSDRLMTAVSSEYFTTLDDVFEETFGDDRSQNVLHQLLPDRLRMALCDLLYHPGGLRLRDKLSHMEICYKNVSKDVWSFCFNILSTTILFLARDQVLTVTGEHFISMHEPLYHPLAFTLRTIAAMGKHLLRLELTSCPDGIDVTVSEVDLEPACHALAQYFGIRLHHGSSDNCPDISELLFPSGPDSSLNLSTSSAFKPVAEWCRLSQLVAQNTETALKCMLVFSSDREKMLQDRKLRARQRKNFTAFHNYKSSLVKMFQTLHAIITKLIRNLATSHVCVVKNVCVVKKQHKSLLQLSENMSTLINDNKWANTVAYFGTFVELNFS